MTKAFFVVLPVTNPVDLASATPADNEPPNPDPAKFELTLQGDFRVLYFGTEVDMQPIPGKFVQGKPRRRDVRPHAWLTPIAVQVAQSRACFVVASESIRMLRELRDRAQANGLKGWTKAGLQADDGALATAIKAAADPDDLVKFRRVLAGTDPGALDSTTEAEVDAADPIGGE